MTGEQALLAVVAVTGIPGELLVETEGQEGYFVFESSLTGKTYYAERAERVDRLTKELKEDIHIFGKHAGLYVYEQKAWWAGLI